MKRKSENYINNKEFSQAVFSYVEECNECKKNDTIQAYRDFYMAHKREFATWKTQVPSWFK